MFLSGAFSRTTSGNVSRIVFDAAKVVPQRVDHSLIQNRDYSRRCNAPTPRATKRSRVQATPLSVEDVFYQALSRASLCDKHAREFGTKSHPRPRRRAVIRRSGAITRRYAQQHAELSYHDESWQEEDAQTGGIGHSRGELRDLVDIYDEGNESLEDPQPRLLPPPIRQPEVSEDASSDVSQGSDHDVPVSYTHLTLPTKRIV